MEFLIGAVLVLAFLVLVFWKKIKALFSKKKQDGNEVIIPDVGTIANLTMKLQENDSKGIPYKVSILPISESKEKFTSYEDMLDYYYTLLGDNIPKDGEFVPSISEIYEAYKASEVIRGLYETVYTYGSKRLHIYLLVVEDKEEVEPVEPEDPIIEPTKPEKERPVLEAKFNGAPVVIPASDENSLTENGKDVPFTLRALLELGSTDEYQWIASKRDNQNREWELIVYKGMLVLFLYGADRATLGRGLLLEELPKEKFLLHIEYLGTNSTGSFIWTLNGKEVETEHLKASTYGGMIKSNAPVFIGKAGFNENYAFQGTADIRIEKNLWTAEEKLEDYKQTFGIEDVYVKPASDGFYYVDVEPNTGEDVSIALNEAIEQIPNGTPNNPSIIKLKGGRYNVDRKHIAGYISGGAIDMYARKHLKITTVGDEPAILYVTSSAVEPFPLIRGQLNLTGKRSQIRGQKCEDIEIDNIRVESTNKMKSFKASLEFEHGITFLYSNNIRVKNYKADGTWGDGFYAWHTDNILLENIETINTNRQGIGFSNGCKNIVIDGHIADKCTRAAVDFEPQSGGDIINIEIKNSIWYDGHLAAGGSGAVNNLHFHHNKHRARLAGAGGFSHPRENWIIEDNEQIGGAGSTMPFVQIQVTRNVIIRRNKYNISDTQSRWGVLVAYCSGEIVVEDNDFTNASRITLTDIEKDSNVTVRGNTPIEEDGLIEYNLGYASKKGIEPTTPQVVIEYKE